MAQGVETRLVCGRNAAGQVVPLSTDSSGIMGAGILGRFDDVSGPLPGTAATITFGAQSGVVHVISGIAWSYDGNPTGGAVTITDGGVLVFSLDITASGPGFIPFNPPKKGTAGAALVVRLASAGATISGKVNVLAHWTE